MRDYNGCFLCAVLNQRVKLLARFRLKFSIDRILDLAHFSSRRETRHAWIAARVFDLERELGIGAAELDV